jgi:hypothetical protein
MIGFSLLAQPVTIDGATTIDVYFPGKNDVTRNFMFFLMKNFNFFSIVLVRP